MTQLADLPIDRAAVSAVLQDIGVDLTHSLAPAFVLAGADAFLAIELAEVLPAEASYVLALDQLACFRPNPSAPLAPAVVDVLWRVLDASMQDPEGPVIEESRLDALRRRLELLSESA